MRDVAGPLLRLDRDLRVMEANPAAEALLARQEAVALQDGTLRPRRAPERAALQSIALGLSAAEGKRAVILRSRQGAPVLLIVLRFLGEGTLLASLADLEAAVPPAPEELTMLFGLTGGEARVLSLIAVGAAPAEVARRMSLKPETVRGHLKAGMRKMGVRSQVQLVGRMLRALEIWRG